MFKENSPFSLHFLLKGNGSNKLVAWLPLLQKLILTQRFTKKAIAVVVVAVLNNELSSSRSELNGNEL